MVWKAIPYKFLKFVMDLRILNCQNILLATGQARGDPAPWIDAIAQQTHGWPRHVHSYARHAAEHLKEKGGLMTPQGLKIVMELGEEGRKQYYKTARKWF